MKKIILGLIIGLVIAIPIGAHADGVISMIGKQVQGTFNIKLYDKDLTDQAIVIDGISYLPVRVIGENLGLKVRFDPTNGISLSDPGETPELKAQRDNEKLLQGLKKQSEDLNKQISELQKNISPYESSPMVKMKDITYDQAKIKRDELINKLNSIDKQIQDILK